MNDQKRLLLDNLSVGFLVGFVGSFAPILASGAHISWNTLEISLGTGLLTALTVFKNPEKMMLFTPKDNFADNPKVPGKVDG